MKRYTIFFLLVFITSTIAWDYFLFVQVWPGSWLVNSNITDYNFTNSYFSIHGIWPEYDNGSWPQYCPGEGQYKKFNVTNLTPIYQNLTKYWTDFKDPIDFWTHEYYKHMLCAENIYHDPYDLFWKGLGYRQSINLYQILLDNNIYPNNKYKYNTNTLQNIIKNEIGFAPSINCQNNIINEIQLCMTKDLILQDCPIDRYHDYNQYCYYNYYKNKANLTIEPATATV